MPAQALPTELEPAAQPDADAQYYRRVLHKLIDQGADLASQAHAQAKAEPAAAGADPTIAFDRIARCIRRCIALARRLDDPAPARTDRVQLRVAARKLIIRSVEDAIQREVPACNAEAAYAEFIDRLDEPDLDDDIDGRPIDEIIADICRDLGLGAPRGAHPWQRRTPEDIATLHALATAPPGGTALMARTRVIRDWDASKPP